MLNLPTGAQIGAARGLAGISGKRLAELAKISPTTLNKVEAENGYGPVSAKNLEAIALVFDEMGIEFISGGVRFKG